MLHDALNPLPTTNGLGSEDTAYACFTIGQTRYAIDARSIHRVMEWKPKPAPEHVPSYVVGATTYHDIHIPIMDLSAPFEPRAIDQPARVLVLRYAEDMIGILIDSLEVKTLPDTLYLKRIAIERNASGISLIAAVLLRGEDQYILLDAAKLFEQTRAGMVAHMLETRL